MLTKVLGRISLILGLLLLSLPAFFAQVSCGVSWISESMFLGLGAIFAFFGLYAVLSKLKSPLRGVITIIVVLVLGFLAWLIPIMASFGRCVAG